MYLTGEDLYTNSTVNLASFRLDYEKIKDNKIK